MGLTKDDLLVYLDGELGVDTADVNEQTPLFSSGVIDSFALISLISHIESSCGFRMSPTDVNLDNLDTIERMLDYIEKTVGAG